MNAEHQALIRAFVENKAMFAAVCAVLLPEKDSVKDIDRAIDDAEYGRKVKVEIETRERIAERIADLERAASTNPQPAQTNHAR